MRILKNIILYATLVGNGLHASDAQISTLQIFPEAVVQLIHEYNPEPRIIEKSKTTEPFSMDRLDMCFHPWVYNFWRKIDLIKQENPYRYSRISSPDRFGHIHVNNVYRSPELRPGGHYEVGRSCCFTSILPRRCRSWDVTTVIYHTAWEYYYANRPQEKQDAKTNKNRQLFGSIIVPEGSSASFFPKRNNLIVANETAVTSYGVTRPHQNYKALDDALNPAPAVAAEKEKTRRMYNALMVGTALGLATKALSSFAKNRLE